MFSLMVDNENDLQKYLLAKITDSLYAFKAIDVVEVIPLIEISAFDSSSNSIGLINLRGESISVYDLCTFLGKKPSAVSEKSKIIILSIKDYKFALLVDDLVDIVHLSEEKFVSISKDKSFMYSSVSEGRTIAIVDVKSFYKYAVNPQTICDKYSFSVDSLEKNALSIIRERTEVLNKPNRYNIYEHSFLKEKYIMFRLGKEMYAFNISYIIEIKKILSSKISHLPCVPNFIRGLVSYKGDYICLIDIKTFLNIEISPLQEKTEILIIDVNDIRIAMLVDEIIAIDKLNSLPTNTDEESLNTFISGEICSDKGIVNMLNVEKLFSSKYVNIESY